MYVVCVCVWIVQMEVCSIVGVFIVLYLWMKKTVHIKSTEKMKKKKKKHNKK